jgi:sigma-E factor negative regulatory protein RseC
MIETQARVTAVEPGYAWVESERQGGCSQCSTAGSCGVSSLSKLFGVKQVRMRLPDTVGLAPGDDVVIGLSERRLVTAAAAVYLFPLLSAILLALLGVHLGQGQGALALLSIAGFIAGMWLVKHRAEQSAVAHRYLPVLLGKQPAGLCTIELKPVFKGVHHE